MGKRGDNVRGRGSEETGRGENSEVDGEMLGREGKAV